jgi:ClpP class serine protease
MATWTQSLAEIKAANTYLPDGAIKVTGHDSVRRRYLKTLADQTERNIVAYYSSWLNKPNIPFGGAITDEDKTGFMIVVPSLDPSKGLDIILHTPGGDVASTQSIVDYLQSVFGDDIRAIVPQIALSAGTMIACCCREIWMALHSNLGPIDPQVRGVPAYGVLREFKRAIKECKDDPDVAVVWANIIQQYGPTFLEQCDHAIKWSNGFVKEQLAGVMFKGDSDAKAKAQKVVKALTHYTTNRTHDRHIHFSECVKMGLKAKALETKRASSLAA